METRQTITAFVIALLAFLTYLFVATWFFSGPRPNGAASEPSATTQSAASAPTGAAETAASDSPAPATNGATVRVMPADPAPAVELGRTGTEATPLHMRIDPVGAGIREIDLSARDAKGRFVHPQSADRDEPYTVVSAVAVNGGAGAVSSFRTHQLWVRERDNRGWRLDDVPWQVITASADRVVLGSGLLLDNEDGSESERVTVRKTYALHDDQPFIDMTVELTNDSKQPLTVTLAQDGPVGVSREHIQFEMRRVIVAHDGEGTVRYTARDRNTLVKNGVQTVLTPEEPFAWTALTNKYFGVFTRPLPLAGDQGQAIAIQKVDGLAVGPATVAPEAAGDMVARMITQPVSLAPGESRSMKFEIYAGPKDPDVLSKINPAFTDTTKIGYSLAQGTDRRCMCTFEPLPWLMTELMRLIHLLVRNYGVAIIVLVIIVRTVMHPMTVFQQRSMYRMQEAMGKLQPKMAAIKEKYANDQTRQNQEMMKLWAEENVNPFASMVAMVPMLLQMPILVALWTALNTDVQLRLAPFDGYWITDLSAPDALIKFSGNGLTIPLLGHLPLIGTLFRDIPSFNLLPILMGISMWLQQKYMPKPHLQAKLEEAKKNPEKQKAAGGMSAEDQIRQQQMIANMMAVMLPIMFYYMPSGLVLYWMATNVFGIFESLRIRKQLEREKQMREAGVLPPPKRREPGALARMMRRMAEQAEELQRTADEASGRAPKKRRKVK